MENIEIAAIAATGLVILMFISWGIWCLVRKFHGLPHKLGEDYTKDGGAV